MDLELKLFWLLNVEVCFIDFILYKFYTTESTNVEEHRQSGAKNLKSGRGAGECKLDGSGIETCFGY